MQHRRVLKVAAVCLAPLLLQASLATARGMGPENGSSPMISVREPMVAGVVKPPVLLPREPVQMRIEREAGPVSAQMRQEQGIQRPAVAADALCPQWWGLARELGWPEEAMQHLDVVLHRESRCLVEAYNREDPNGGSRGLAQINGSWTKWLRDRGILRKADDLYDPAVNLSAALAIYLYGIEKYEFGWGPWGFRYVYPYKG